MEHLSDDQLLALTPSRPAAFAIFYRRNERPILAYLLSELPAEQADAVRERVVEERSYEQIAAEMRCSPSVVRKRVSRGLAAMRAAIGERP